MAIRLTEEEVHLACAEIASQGERPTSLNLLDKLGRGSLTTITKYLNSWNVSDDAQAIEAESLPAVVQLPSELSKEGEDLLKKMWNVAKNITDNELEIQREALKQAEIANQSKVEEAFNFSEAQTMKIERLEEDLTSMKNQLDAEFTAHKQTSNQLNEAEKTNVGLTKDNEQFQKELKTIEIDLKTTNKTASDAEKMVAKLEGKLEVYKSLEKPNKEIKDS